MIEVQADFCGDEPKTHLEIPKTKCLHEAYLSGHNNMSW